MSMSKKEFAKAWGTKVFATMSLGEKAWAAATRESKLRQMAMEAAVVAELREREALLSALAQGSGVADFEKRLRELPEVFASTTALKAIALSSMGLEAPPKILGLIEEPSMRDCQRMANESRRSHGATRPFWEGAPFAGPIAAALNDLLECRQASEE